MAFTCLGFLAEWNRFKNGSDVHDAIGAYLRKIVTVARASDWWGSLPYKSSLTFYPSQIFSSLEELVLHQGSGNELESRSLRAYTVTTSAKVLTTQHNLCPRT